ncbi:hypothetical protein K4K60_001839 [Colletotrichum sp. SAR11_57]|nr:hypothetical protein K4K60_001839 [Colletotrichum sp. SAR11_57]
MADKSSLTQDQDSSHTKRDDIVHNVVGDVEGEAAGERKRGWFHRSGRSEERKLLLKLDFFILLLDASNLRNAYVSGMKEDLELFADQYNYSQTLWTIGYTVGMIPSQIIVTLVRPSIWLPSIEVTWAILTFCFAAVKNYKHIYALRLLLGLAESPFYVGGMTLLGSWYTPKGKHPSCKPRYPQLTTQQS